jgi:hypothetical protein
LSTLHANSIKERHFLDLFKKINNNYEENRLNIAMKVFEDKPLFNINNN